MKAENQNSTETHKKVFFLVEVAEGLYLVAYSQESCYCADGSVYVTNIEHYGKIFESVKETNPDIDPDELKHSAYQFKSADDAFDYIERNGTFDDFKDWCDDLCKKYGGNPEHYPKIKEVHATLTVDLGDSGATMLKRENHKKKGKLK